MRRIGIVGGETHIGEITRLRGQSLEIAAAAVRPDQTEWARQQFGCDVTTDVQAVVQRDGVDIIAVANENDRRAEVILAALAAGRDVIADKPLAITMPEQECIEGALRQRGRQRLLNLLTLRGDPQWAGLRDLVRSGRIGTPAFTHVRMAVQLKRAQRPPWFLDVRRSGGLFLDLLIHALDYVEWLTDSSITAMTAHTGNLGEPGDANLRDHASAFCELANGGTACLEGQRMLPGTKGSDYRVMVAGTKGYADLVMGDGKLTVTSPDGAAQAITTLPAPASVVADWLAGGQLVPQAASLRANRLALWATISAAEHRRVEVA